MYITWLHAYNNSMGKVLLYGLLYSHKIQGSEMIALWPEITHRVSSRCGSQGQADYSPDPFFALGPRKLISMSLSLRLPWIWPMGSTSRRGEARKRDRPGYVCPFPQLRLGLLWLHSLARATAPIGQPLSDAAGRFFPLLLLG